MADIINSIFKNKKADFSKLEAFGFKHKGSVFVYNKVLDGSKFVMTVSITEQGKASAQVIDPEFDELYTLHLMDSSQGEFVGEVKYQYEKIISEIAERCFVPDVFNFEQTLQIMKYIKDKYNDEPEYLWDKFVGNAVCRRKDTGKWYILFCKLSKRKLGIDSDEIVEIIDLHIKPEKMDVLIDNKLYYPGYHMNKKHWYTVILDESVDLLQLQERIDESYELAGK